MRERLKTFLLVSLVGISLVFTKRLWIEFPNQIFGVLGNKDEASSVSYLLSDMIIPNKYLLTFNEQNHTLFYDDSKHRLWTTARRALAEILGSKDIKIEDISQEKFLEYRGKKSIVFYFPEEMNTYILAKALDVKDPNYIVDTIPNVKSIHIYLGKEDSFFILSNKDKYVSIYDKQVDISNIMEQFTKIEESSNKSYYYSMKDVYNTKNDVYIPYNMKGTTLPTVYVENEIRNLDEDSKREMAERFFEKGIDYIGEIVESNGSSIYIYNQRVLKFNINGTLEYFHALEEPVRKRNLFESLRTASEFISNKSGVPKGMYLAKVENIKVDDSFGYNLTFRYRVRGLPIILGNEEVVDFVQIEVFNDKVRTYKHFIRKDMNKTIDNIHTEKNMLTSFEVIDMNHDFIVEKYIEDNNISLSSLEVDIEDVLSSIEDINLSYFDPCLKDIEDRLIPVWAIRTNNFLYAFDIYDGTLIYEKKLEK